MDDSAQSRLQRDTGESYPISFTCLLYTSLLKPCNESQIIDAIKKASGEIRRRKKIKELVPEAVISENISRYHYKEYINQILDYVDLHFADPNLSLKWIAQNILYMNVDCLLYTSRCV